MKKSFALAGVALAAASIPAAAGATAIVGDTVSCTTNTFDSSGCNTGQTPPGFETISTTVVAGGLPEFYINTIPNGGSANPLITANFENGILTLQGLGNTARTFSGTVLTFANLTKPWRTASTAGLLGGLNQGLARVSVSNGLLRVDLRGTAWSAASSSQIAVTAVPEPGTWMLMILGLGAVGFSMRRRQNVTARLQFA